MEAERRAKDRGNPGHHQTQHVTQVVPCVGDQGDRIREQPIDDLGDDEAQIKRGAGGKRQTKILRRMSVPMPCIVCVVVAVLVIVIPHEGDPGQQVDSRSVTLDRFT